MRSVKKLLLHNVSGITVFAVGALVLFLAAKTGGGGRLLLVLTGNTLFILGVLILIFHEKLTTDMWKGKVHIFVRTLVYFTLLISTVMVLMIAIEF